MIDKQKWSAEEIDLLKQLRPTYTLTEIQRIFAERGIDRTCGSIRRQCRQQGLRFEGPNKLSYTTFGIDPPKKATTVDDFFNEIREYKGTERRQSFRPERYELQPQEEELVVCLSDIHFGSKVDFGNGDFEDTEPNMVYNSEIARERLESLPDKIIQGTAGRNIKRVNLVLVGDIIDGEEIYPTHAHHIDIPLLEQTKGVVKPLWYLIKELAKHFLSIHIVSVPGNHGRASKTSNERTNWDNVVYQQLELLADEHISEDYSITYQSSRNNYTTFFVGSWKGYVEHEAIRHVGTPAQCAKLGGWNSIHNFDFLICGHWHSAEIFGWNGKTIFKNGALKGMDDLGQSMGRCDPPTQIIFGITAEACPSFIQLLRW